MANLGSVRYVSCRFTNLSALEIKDLGHNVLGLFVFYLFIFSSSSSSLGRQI